MRLFRALAALLFCLAVVHGADMFRLFPEAGVAQAADDSLEDGEDVVGQPVETEQHEEEEAVAGQECLRGKDFAGETGLSQYEIQVLRSLSDRRKVLDRRGQELDVRTRTAEAAELRLQEQITQLRDLEGDLHTLLGQMQVQRDQRLDGLVRVYETMKPKDAARIFDTLSRDVLLDMSMRMKHGSLSAIMAKMSADRARLLTGLLARQVEIPENVSELREQAG